MSDDAAKFDARLMVEQIEERRNATTPGKWRISGESKYTHGLGADWVVMVGASDVPLCSGSASISDAEFIAQAPEDIRWLLQRIEDLEESLKEALEEEGVTG